MENFEQVDTALLQAEIALDREDIVTAKGYIAAVRTFLEAA